MSIGSVSVSVVPSAEGFGEKLRADLLPQADEIGSDVGERIRLGIDERLSDITIDPHARTAAAEAELEALQLKVDELKHDRADINVDVHNAAGVRSWIVSLIASAVAIAPAFVVAGAGVAAFAVFAAPALKKVIDYEEELGTNAQKAGQMLAGMSGPERQMVEGISALKDEFNGLSASIRPEVFAAFNAGLHEAEELLPEIAPMARAGGQAVKEMIDDIGGAFTDSQGQQFFAFVTKNLPQDVHAIDTTVVALIHTFFNLVEALQPVSLGLLQIVNVGANFLSWLSRTAPLLDDVIILAIALAKPLRVIQGLDLAKSFAWIPNSISGMSKLVTSSIAMAEAQKINVAMDEAMVTNQAAFSVSTAGTVVALDAESVALVELTGAERAAAVGMAALDAVNPAVWIAAATAALIGLGIAMLHNGADAVDTTTAALRQQDDAVGFNIAGYQKLASQETVSAAATGKMGDAVKASSDTMVAARVGAAAYSTAVAQVDQVHVQAASAAQHLTSNLQMLEDKYALTQQQAIALAKAAGVSASALSHSGGAATGAMGQIAAYVQQTQGAAQKTSVWAQQMSIATGDAGTLTQRVTALSAAMSALLDPTTNAMQAAVDFKGDQVSLASALDKTHGKLGDMTAAQRAATTATVNAVTGAKEDSAAIDQATGSYSKAAAPLKALRDQLEAAGVTGSKAAALIRELNAQIAALHSKTVDINVRVSEQATSGGLVPTAGGGSGGGPGIRAAGGYVVPGYAPGVDSEIAHVSPGEAIMVPEFTRAVGPRNIDAINDYFSGGRKSSPGHFAGGGTVTLQQALGNQTDFNIYLSVLNKDDTGTALTTALNKLLAGVKGEMQAERSYASQIKQGLKSDDALSNITGSTDPTTGATNPVTGQDIKAGLQKDLAQLKKFFDILGKLKKMKLSKALLSQVAAMDPASGIEYGEAIISGGEKLIKEINQDEKDINKYQTKVGDRAAEIQMGQSITKGFEESLRKDEAKLKKELEKLGKSITTGATGGGSSGGGGGGGGGSGGGSTTTAVTIGGIRQLEATERRMLDELRTIAARVQTGDSREKDLATKAQMNKVISLLTAAPKATGSATGTAVADALNGLGGTAANKARATVRG